MKLTPQERRKLRRVAEQVFTDSFVFWGHFDNHPTLCDKVKWWMYYRGDFDGGNNPQYMTTEERALFLLFVAEGA